MKKRRLLARIEELERRLAEVEARPRPALPPIRLDPPPHVPAPHWVAPWWSIVPPSGSGSFTVTCTNGMPTTVNTTAGQVQAWIANPQHGM